MIEFNNGELKAIEDACNDKLVHLENVYKCNVNERPDYAELIANSMLKYLAVLEKIYPGYQFVTFSPSLEKYLYGSRKLEVVDG